MSDEPLDPSKDRWTLGNWNAWAVSGDTYEERKARLEAAPERLQPQVLIHLRTAYALKIRADGKQKSSSYKDISARAK